MHMHKTAKLLQQQQHQQQQQCEGGALPEVRQPLQQGQHSGACGERDHAHLGRALCHHPAQWPKLLRAAGMQLSKPCQQSSAGSAASMRTQNPLPLAAAAAGALPLHLWAQRRAAGCSLCSV